MENENNVRIFKENAPLINKAKELAGLNRKHFNQDNLLILNRWVAINRTSFSDEEYQVLENFCYLAREYQTFSVPQIISLTKA